MEKRGKIMKKVREKEKKLSDLDRCLNVLICPICGGALTFTRFSCFSDVVFKCMQPCRFIYKRKWEKYNEHTIREIQRRSMQTL